MYFRNKPHALVTCTLTFSLSLSLAAAPMGARAQQNPTGLALPNTAQVQDVFSPLPPDQIRLTGGMLGPRIDRNAKNRLLAVDEDDLLDGFERRNVPHQDWQGEHVGKFLHAATLAWQNTHDPALKTKLDRVVARLLKTQEPDGYLGTYPANKRWTSWDVWIHKYDLLGLLTYYQYIQERKRKRKRRKEKKAGQGTEDRRQEPHPQSANEQSVNAEHQHQTPDTRCTNHPPPTTSSPQFSPLAAGLATC